MRTQRSRTSRRAGAKRGRGPRRNPDSNTIQNVARLSGIEDFAIAGATFPAGSLSPSKGMLTVTQTTGTVGDLTGVDGTYIPLAPGMLGVRVLNLADCYTQYKMRKVVIDYRPNVTAIDTTVNYTYNNASGNSYAGPDWTGIVAFVRDPAWYGSVITVSEALNYGGKRVDMSKPWSYSIAPRGPWRYQNMPGSNIAIGADVADVRQQFAGNLLFLWETPSGGAFPFTRTGTDTSALYVTVGNLRASWWIDFRYPADPDITRPTVMSTHPSFVLLNRARTSRRLPGQLSQDVKPLEEKKKEDGPSKLELANQPPGRGGWFG